MPRDKYFKYQNFSDTFSLAIIPGMFRRNLTEIGEILILYKFAYSGCVPPKIKCEILATIRS